MLCSFSQSIQIEFLFLFSLAIPLFIRQIEDDLCLFRDDIAFGSTVCQRTDIRTHRRRRIILKPVKPDKIAVFREGDIIFYFLRLETGDRNQLMILRILI